MPKAEWGTKRICPTTGKRFYDLNRSPIVSPYTGEVVDIESARRKMAASVIARVAPEKDDDVLVDDLDTYEDLLTPGVADDAELDRPRGMDRTHDARSIGRGSPVRRHESPVGVHVRPDRQSNDGVRARGSLDRAQLDQHDRLRGRDDQPIRHRGR